MVSLIAPESEARLRKLFGADFDTLTPIEVQTLVTADLEGEVSNSRLQLIRSEHPVELTKLLQSLTTRGFLDQIGLKRGTSHCLPVWPSSLAPGASSLAIGPSHETDPLLLEIAKPAREKKKLVPALTKTIIRKLCSGRYLSANQIGILMDRGKDKLQKNALSVMVADGELVLRFPDQPTHPNQAYTTKEQP